MASTKVYRKQPRELYGRNMAVSSWMKFYGGVFFTFMPVFLLFGAGVRMNADMKTILFWGVISGFIGVGYAWVFTRRVHRALAVIVPAHIAMIILSAMGLPQSFQVNTNGGDGTGFFIIFTIAAGYTFFSWFIRTEGARAYRLSEEMRLAGRIHDRLVPEIRIANDRAEVFGVSIASTEMGGDLIDSVQEADGSLSLYLADVSGHGVRAGVLMAMIKSAIRASHLRATSLEQTCAEINAVIEQVKEPDMFATYASVRIAAGGGIQCALAGHLPIVQVSSATGEITYHDNESLPLGVVAEESFAARTVSAASGDLLAIYTDGLTEAADRSRRLFGAPAVDEILRERRGEPLRSIFDAVLDAVTANDGGAHEDDQSLLLIRVQ